jgi:hypothetical protein
LIPGFTGQLHQEVILLAEEVLATVHRDGFITQIKTGPFPSLIIEDS